MARHTLAVIALAAVALCSTFWTLLDFLGDYSHNRIFGVAAFESRFDELRKTIRPRTVYGYLSDNARNDPSAGAEFYLTQYTLAPAIVKPTPDEPLVVVNLHVPKPDQKLLQANKLVLVQNFGSGVLLCRRVQR